jgi:protein-L-isoaspartate O-methyltransferase
MHYSEKTMKMHMTQLQKQIKKLFDKRMNKAERHAAVYELIRKYEEAQMNYNKAGRTAAYIVDNYVNREAHNIEAESLEGYARKRKSAKNRFRFIPCHVFSFLMELFNIENTVEWRKLREALACERRPNFVDCGCGIGNKMLQARNTGLFGEVYGIEFDPVLIKKAKEMLGSLGGKKVYKHDIITYKKYAMFDLIYFYCPLRNGDYQRKFERAVARQARVGAIILPWSCGSTFDKDKRFKRIKETRAYVKTKA